METRILIVDDHGIMRQGLKLLLERQPGMVVVGETSDGRSAVTLAADLRPDVVLMDISMPGLNGIDATRQIRQSVPAAKVIALTAHCDRSAVREILKAGAAGYVVKDSVFDEVEDALRSVMAGRVYLSPRIAGSVVENFVADQGSDGAAGVFARLSAREREVLQLMAEGKATKEVARALNVSVKTAETHRRAIMQKLDLYSVAELTKYAIREGLTSVEQ
jgi:DNA-binding NarL/FixJ family response regulator